jgi:hypothetical protein
MLRVNVPVELDKNPFETHQRFGRRNLVHSTQGLTLGSLRRAEERPRLNLRATSLLWIVEPALRTNTVVLGDAIALAHTGADAARMLTEMMVDTAFRVERKVAPDGWERYVERTYGTWYEAARGMLWRDQHGTLALRVAPSP